jgi:Tfp pilus assembly protein PilN
MKIPINLASQPFQRVRAMLVASIAVSVALAGTLVALVFLILADRAQMADVRYDINRLNGALREAQAEQARITGVVVKPENSELLERSVFINSLIYRKGISWTRIFSDLERTLPYNVKVAQIRPMLNSRNGVALDMFLASESSDAMVQALVALENSPLFGELISHSMQTPNQSEPLYRYRVTVNYAQKL